MDISEARIDGIVAIDNPSVQWRIIAIDADEGLVGLEAIDGGTADRWEPVAHVYYV